MTQNLLDINFLLAMAWPNHVHHSLARTWFHENKHKGWATCPITQMGFVRISSNPSFSTESVSVSQASVHLKAITTHSEHHFWQDELPFIHEILSCLFVMGHRQVTDAYLLSLAVHYDGCLITLDQGISNLLPHNSSWSKHLVVVKAG